MYIELQATAQFLDNIRIDLDRPHPFAAERVGFVTTELHGDMQVGKVIILSRYLSVPDNEYVPNELVGAEIGRVAIRRMLGEILSSRQGIMHVHMHDHDGIPRLSRTDATGLPPMIRGFQNLSLDVANGILLLSRNALNAWVWLKGGEAQQVTKVSVTGGVNYDQ